MNNDILQPPSPIDSRILSARPSPHPHPQTEYLKIFFAVSDHLKTKDLKMLPSGDNQQALQSDHQRMKHLLWAQGSLSAFITHFRNEMTKIPLVF